MLCRHKNNTLEATSWMFMEKEFVKISYSNKIHIQQMSTQVQIIDYIHTHTPLARTQTELLFLGVCVWDIIMLIMTIIYEIKF